MLKDKALFVYIVFYFHVQRIQKSRPKTGLDSIFPFSFSGKLSSKNRKSEHQIGIYEYEKY